MDPAKPTAQLATVEGRYLLGLFVIVMVGFQLLFPNSNELFVVDAIVSFFTYVFLTWVLWLHCARNGIRVLSILGERPSNKELTQLILIGAALFSIAIASLYVIYLPLSWVKPAFVNELLDMPPVIIWSRAPDEWLANALNIVTLVVVAPIFEEFFFRGFLLNRWWKKYGQEKAIVLSSVVFGFVHIEFVGGIIFGLVLSRLYMRTRSLIGPIIIHMSNNGLVLIIVVLDMMVRRETPRFSLTEFQAYWWLAPVGLVVALPSFTWFYRSYLPSKSPAEPSLTESDSPE